MYSPPARTTGKEPEKLKGNAPPILMPIDASSDRQEVQAVNLLVCLRFDVDELDQSDDRAQISELAVDECRFKPGEGKRRLLADVARQVVRVDEVERPFRTVRVRVERHAGDVERLEQRLHLGVAERLRRGDDIALVRGEIL